MVRPLLPAILVTTSFVLSLAACAPAAAPPSPPTVAPTKPSAGPASEAAAQPLGVGVPAELQRLIAGARDEGQLTLVWGEDTLGGRNAVQRWAAGFNSLYGLNVKVEFTPGPSMPQMANRILQEFQAGRTASSDLILGTETHIATLIQAGALESVEWSAWAPNIRDPRLVAPRGVAVEITSATPGITYHASRVADETVPQTLQSLLQPQYKGHIASTPYAGYFDILASPELWGESRTVEYATRLADQIAGLMRCGEIERLASGEFDILAISCSANDARLWPSKGVPIAHVIPADAALLVYRYAGVPKNAVHSNAAKLFVNYLLSREAQDVLFQLDFNDHHLMEGSKSAGEIERVQAAGVKFAEIDVEFYLRSNPENTARILSNVQQILGRAR